MCCIQRCSLTLVAEFCVLTWEPRKKGCVVLLPLLSINVFVWFQCETGRCSRKTGCDRRVLISPVIFQSEENLHNRAKQRGGGVILMWLEFAACSDLHVAVTKSLHIFRNTFKSNDLCCVVTLVSECICSQHTSVGSSSFLAAAFCPLSRSALSSHFTSALILLLSCSLSFLLALYGSIPTVSSPPDKWGHSPAAGTGASRAPLLRAQSVKPHQSHLNTFLYPQPPFFYFSSYLPLHPQGSALCWALSRVDVNYWYGD